MSTLALPDDLARAAAQQVAIERQAAAILQNLTFGIYCHLAAEAYQDTPGHCDMRPILQQAADRAEEAAIVMAERMGFHFSRRAPESPT
jgi:hypothetical protein